MTILHGEHKKFYKKGYMRPRDLKFGKQTHMVIRSNQVKYEAIPLISFRDIKYFPTGEG